MDIHMFLRQQSDGPRLSQSQQNPEKPNWDYEKNIERIIYLSILWTNRSNTHIGHYITTRLGQDWARSWPRPGQCGVKIGSRWPRPGQDYVKTRSGPSQDFLQRQELLNNVIRVLCSHRMSADVLRWTLTVTDITWARADSSSSRVTWSPVGISTNHLSAISTETELSASGERTRRRGGDRPSARPFPWRRRERQVP